MINWFEIISGRTASFFSPRRKLILHIGTHKTGSTALQVTLHANRKLLQKTGLVYPKPPKGTAHHYLVSEWNSGLAFDFPPVENPEADWGRINEICRGRPTTVILSSEEFSRYKQPGPVDFGVIRKRLKTFSGFQVVCVLREQVSLLQAIYLQIRNRPELPEFSLWLEDALNKGHADGLFLNFNDIHEHLINSFSEKEITYLSFKEAQSHQFGVTGLFLDQFDFSQWEQLQARKVHNVSVDPLGYCQAKAMTSPKIPTRHQIAAAGRAILSEHPGKVRTSLYSPREIALVHQKYAAENDRFVRNCAPQLKGALDLQALTEKVLYRSG